MKRTSICSGPGIVGLMFILFSLQSCQTHGIRRPSSDNKELISANKLEEVYARSIELDSLAAFEKKIGNSSSTGASSGAQEASLMLWAKTQEDKSKIKSLNSEIQAQVEGMKADVPKAQWGEFKKAWRVQKEKLVISDPANYALVNGKIVREFTLDLSGSNDYQLTIFNKTWDLIESKAKISDEDSEDHELDLNGSESGQII